MANVDKNECLINGVQYKCRTCFDPGRTIYQLTDEASNKKTWIDLLKNVGQLQMNDEENLPKTLCCKCSDKLKRSYDFVIQIQNTNEKYAELLAKHDALNQVDSIADCLEESAIALPLAQYVPEVKLEDEMVMPYDMDIANKLEDSSEERFENEDNDDPFDDDNATETLGASESAIETTGENTTKRKPRKQKSASPKLICKQVKRRSNRVVQSDAIIANATEEDFNSDAKEAIPCGKCSKTFSTMHAYQRHQQEEHYCEQLDEDKGACPLCAKKFSNRFYVNDHIKNVHDKLKPFKCSNCTKSFATAAAKKTHELTHTDDFPFKCEFCDKRFRLSIKLKYHLEIHTTKPELLCPICKRGQKSQTELEAHVKNHDDNRFQCPSCGHLFRKKTNLNEHYNAVHLKLRPYKCEVCQQSFGDRKSRRVHERSHQKQKISAK